jgi:hypothetical protein
MGIEPTSEAPQAIEYTGFLSLVRVQLRPTSGNLKPPPSPALWLPRENAYTTPTTL